MEIRLYKGMTDIEYLVYMDRLPDNSVEWVMDDVYGVDSGICNLEVFTDSNNYTLLDTYNDEENTVDSIETCKCDLFTVLMAVGCKCGGK